jgi:apolipoprotein N-acyltransferase
LHVVSWRIIERLYGLLCLLFITSLIICSVITFMNGRQQEQMMKTPIAILTAALLATASFTAFAAQPLSAEQAENLQSSGTVSISGVRGSIDDATRQLSQKAEDMGASHYRVIGVQNPGDSSLWSGTAEIYR